jgi:hypothetical protein
LQQQQGVEQRQGVLAARHADREGRIILYSPMARPTRRSSVFSRFIREGRREECTVDAEEAQGACEAADSL